MGIQQVSGQAAAYVPQPAPQRAPDAGGADPRPVPDARSEQPVQTQPLPSQVSQQQLEEAMQRMKEAIKPIANNSLEFSIDESTGKTVVRIVDAATKEVVRQIPSEEMLAIARGLDSEIKGLLLQSKA